MRKNRFLISLFFGILLLIPIFLDISPFFAGIVAILGIFVLTITLIQVLSHHERKMYKGIKIEFNTFFRHHVFRTYLKPKRTWIVYDRLNKRFRSADFRDLPMEVGVLGLFGAILLYIAFLILITLAYPEFLLFRFVILLVLTLFGFYNISIAGARLISMQSEKSEKLSLRMNQNKSLRNFVEKKENNVEVTPNFHLTDGFVTSVEFISTKAMEKRKLEKTLVDISKIVDRL